MKFRHLEKVKVKNGYYRNYNGVVVSALAEVLPKGCSDEPNIKYKVKLTISKDPVVVIEHDFLEAELKRRLF